MPPRFSHHFRRARLPLLLAWVSVQALLGPSCAPKTTLRQELDRRSQSDEDLVALLPRGLDAVLDVDVGGLRRLDAAGELVPYLPDRSRERLAVLTDAPLRDLDALVVGLRSLGTKENDFVVVVRGRLSQERVVKGIRALGEAREVEYHGVPLVENLDEQSGLAAALLTARAAVLANRYAVRQVIDIYRGADDSARQQSELMAALGKAPHAKTGRPAVLLAMLMTPQMRDRLHTAELPELGADADFIGAALAVGDGIDLGVVAAYRELSVAKDVANRLLDRAQALRHRPALTFTGMQRFIDSLIAVAAPPNPLKGRNTPELHVAYRLSADDLSELLARLHQLEQLRKHPAGG